MAENKLKAEEEQKVAKPKIRRDDIEDEDDFDTFIKYRKELEAKGLLISETTTADSDDDRDSESYATKNPQKNEEEEIEYVFPYNMSF